MHFWELSDAHCLSRRIVGAKNRGHFLARRAGTGAAPCHKGVIPPSLPNLTAEKDLPSKLRHGSSVSTIQEAPVPTLFRFLLVVAILAGLGFAAMFALATLVKPDPREITVPVSTSRTSSSS